MRGGTFGESILGIETNAEHDMQTCRLRLVYEVVNNRSFLSLSCHPLCFCVLLHLTTKGN